MFESLIGLVAFIALIVVVVRQHGRLGLLEREVGALRSYVLSGPPPSVVAKPAAAASEKAPAAETVSERLSEQPALLADDAPVSLLSEPDAKTSERPPSERDSPSVEDAPVSPWEPKPQSQQDAGPAAPQHVQPSGNADFLTTLGTKWAVWVGGLALALGGIFLVRYSIEAGLFGPAFRLTMAALFGIALVGAGEYIRRTGYKVPIEGAASAYVPGILTAAGAFTLFGTVYAAHGLYGFIGPALAFSLMGIIGVGTIVAALVHGQALAGVGLLGSVVTPVLVSSQSPSPWALFGYLAIVLVANTAIARLRLWTFLAAAGFAGVGFWGLVYMASTGQVELAVVIFINAVTLAALAFVWLGRFGGTQADPSAIDWVSAFPGFFVALASLALLIDPTFFERGEIWGLAFVAAMVAIAFVRQPALPLLYAAGAATMLAHARFAFGGTFAIETVGGQLTIDGLSTAPYSSLSIWTGAALAAILLGAGFYKARELVASAQMRAATWAAWGVIAPLVSVVSFWIAFGNLDQDFTYAFVALILVAIFSAGGELIARAEQPPLTGGLAVSFALAGAGAALIVMLHMAFGPLWTTILAGAAAVIPALATRVRAYPVLGWMCFGAVVVVLGRVALDPTIVGAMVLGRTPVFNALLPGYGIPALAFIFCAWQLARTTDGRPRLIMEAAAALFSLLTLAMLVRHAMNGGVIDSSAPTLAEQAIYTLIAIGAGGIFVALDTRSPSSVLRIGSLAAGIVSVVFIVSQHFLVLNPLFTDESTGRIPFFNLLFLAYLLPAIAAGALALYARGKRPAWYSQMLGLLGAVLLFVYATMSVRRLFHGEQIGLWLGMSQLETYSYSALWLVMGVGLLIGGVMLKSQMLRIASAVLIAVAVAKVFIFDMSELEGVLRALSFIGLGAVLIGIGLFYQRLLTRSAK